MACRSGAGALGLALLLAAGCGAHRPQGLAYRLVQQASGGDITARAIGTSAVDGRESSPAATQTPEAGRLIVKQVVPSTLEGEDGALANALAALAGGPSVERHRAVAEAYQRAGVFDHAEQHLTLAAKLSPRDAGIFERRAQVWRDAGVLARALADAHLAVYYAPGFAEAQNTLGTILHALGHVDQARRRFQTAAALDPAAAYARNNLCYVALTAGEIDEAERACDDALRIDPDFAPAQRNRARVALAVRGDTNDVRAARGIAPAFDPR